MMSVDYIMNSLDGTPKFDYHFFDTPCIGKGHLCYCSDIHVAHARRIYTYYLGREETLSTMSIYITNLNIKFSSKPTQNFKKNSTKETLTTNEQYSLKNILKNK